MEIRTRQTQWIAGTLSHARPHPLSQRIRDMHTIISLSLKRISRLAMLLLLIAIPISAFSANDVIEIKPTTHLNDVQLKIWNDPAFQKQFAESYLAETEIEPRVTVDERKQMQKVL